MAEEINNNGTGTENQKNENTEVKTYTQEEVLALLQSETDKRVSQALKTQQKKYEKQLSLSKLDGDEREKAEKDNRIAELEELVAQMNIDKNKSELKSVLSSRGRLDKTLLSSLLFLSIFICAEFADLIAITDDIEESQAKIDALDKLFKAAVKAEVEKRLAANGGAPRTSSTTGEITKETFKTMSLSQQSQIYKDNPELYKRLTTN